jgi:hypothetical protein
MFSGLCSRVYVLGFRFWGLCFGFRVYLPLPLPFSLPLPLALPLALNLALALSPPLSLTYMRGKREKDIYIQRESAHARERAKERESKREREQERERARERESKRESKREREREEALSLTCGSFELRDSTCLQNKNKNKNK